MDLTAILARVATASGVNQVVEAQTGGYVSPIDASTEIFSQLSNITGLSIDPVTQKDQAAIPSVVYTLVSSTVGEVDGYRITQTDRYVLNLRETTYDLLITLMGNVITQLNASSFDVEVDDILFDYDDVQKNFRANILISFSYLSAAAQTLPAVFVYAIGRAAGENQFDNYVVQRVETQYAFVIATNAGNMDALSDAVRDVLLGWEQVVGNDVFEYSSGRGLEGVAGLELWRDIYQDAEYWREIP